MSQVLVSSCLLGEPVRYDASSKLHHHPFLKELNARKLIISICPEVMGGLPVPRPAAEISQHQVINIKQLDVTAEFTRGAKLTLEQAQKHQVKMAIMKANSPSCSNYQIYDGSFEGTLILGMGITAELLTKNRIRVFNELQLDEAQHYYQQIYTDL